METSFEIAQLTDINTLLELMREYYEYDQLPFEVKAARKALEMLVNDDTLGRIWLIYQGDELAGYIAITLGFSLEYQGRDGFIDEIYLREAYRGRGLGATVFTYVENICRSLGVQALHLEVERHNVPAQKFYQKVGYDAHDRYLLTKWLIE